MQTLTIETDVAILVLRKNNFFYPRNRHFIRKRFSALEKYNDFKLGFTQ